MCVKFQLSVSESSRDIKGIVLPAGSVRLQRTAWHIWPRFRFSASVSTLAAYGGLDTLCKKRPDIWNPRPQFVYSLYNLSGATMTIKGRLLHFDHVFGNFGTVPSCTTWPVTRGVNLAPFLGFPYPQFLSLCNFPMSILNITGCFLSLPVLKQIDGQTPKRGFWGKMGDDRIYRPKKEYTHRRNTYFGALGAEPHLSG